MTSVTIIRNPAESLLDGQGFQPSGHPGALSDQATSVECCVRCGYDSPVRAAPEFFVNTVRQKLPTQLGQFNVAEVFHFLFCQMKLLLYFRI